MRNGSGTNNPGVGEEALHHLFFSPLGILIRNRVGDKRERDAELRVNLQFYPVRF